VGTLITDTAYIWIQGLQVILGSGEIKECNHSKSHLSSHYLDNLEKSLEPLENPFVVWKTRIVIMVSSHDSENWMRASANHVYCNLYSTILNFELEVKAKPFLWDFIF
jgi:hypothetical protein